MNNKRLYEKTNKKLIKGDTMNDITIFHNSHDSYFRNPFGAVVSGTEIELRLEIDCPFEHNSISAQIILFEDDIKKCYDMNNEKNEGSKATFYIKYKITQTPGLAWYFFVVRIDEKQYLYGNNQEQLGGEGVTCYNDPKGYQITVYEQNDIPEWYKQGIMYQIFVDRFANGNGDVVDLGKYKHDNLIHAKWNERPSYIRNSKFQVIGWDFFGGNIKGIIDKIPYLKELGVTILYLNPIFDSSSNHKYDTADYSKIDPAFGDEEILEDLIKKANENDMHIILDGVFSHTGSDSIYFNRNGLYDEIGAYQSTDSKYFSWYRFNEHPNSYESWWGVDTLPNTNELDEGFLKYIVKDEDSIISKWMRLGIKGWRLDVADELPDEFIRELKTKIKELDNDSVLIGEVWEDASRKEAYGTKRRYFLGQELDATMNYPFRKLFINYITGKCHSGYVYHKLMSLYSNYPRQNFMAQMNILGTHDRVRILTILGDSPKEKNLSDEERKYYSLSEEQRILAVDRLKLLSLIQFTFPGVPSIYYGDEAGMEGYSDPYNRGTYPWGYEDKQLLGWFKQIAKLRTNSNALKSGVWEPRSIDDDVFGYIRTSDDEKIICIFNRNKECDKTVNITRFTQPSDHCEVLISTRTLDKNGVQYKQIKGDTITLERLEGIVIKI